MGRMANAVKTMEEALRYSRRDMFGGGTYSDVMERNALQSAEREMMGARIAVFQATQMDVMIEELSEFEAMSQQDLIADVLLSREVSHSVIGGILMLL
jgi:hypothetical protein